MKTSFYLHSKSRKNSDERSIGISFSEKGKRFQKLTGVTVEELLWNQKTQKVKRGHKNHQILNKKLSELQNSITEKYYEMIGAGQYDFKDIKAFMEYLISPEKEIKYNKTIQKVESMDIWFEEFYKYQVKMQKAKGTLFRYRNAYEHLRTALKQAPKEISSSDILTYANYLLKKVDCQNISIDSKFRALRVFLEWVTFQKEVDQSKALYQMKKITKEWNLKKRKKIFPLEIEEVKIIHNHTPSSEKLSKIKDLFLFQIYTALDYSTIQSVSPNTFLDENILSVIRNKTGEEAEFYLPNFAQKIRDKYQMQLPKYSNQKYNSYIKELCKEAGLDRKVRYYEYRGKDIKTIEKKLWEHVTTHDARRTFVNVAYEIGYSEEEIIIYTAHAGKEVLKYYIDKKRQKRAANEKAKKVWKDANIS